MGRGGERLFFSDVAAFCARDVHVGSAVGMGHCRKRVRFKNEFSRVRVLLHFLSQFEHEMKVRAILSAKGT